MERRILNITLTNMIVATVVVSMLTITVISYTQSSTDYWNLYKGV